MTLDPRDPWHLPNVDYSQHFNTKDAVAAALQYDPKTDDLPHIIANGKGALAEQILKIAFEQGIAVRKDKDLAQILAQFDLDTPIPPEAIVAVAEIFAYLYRLNQITLNKQEKDIT